MTFNSVFRGSNVNVCILVLLLASGAGWHGPVQAKPAPTGFAGLSEYQRASLDELEKRTFEYFRDSPNTANGQVPDHWPRPAEGDYFSSIAAVGFGLTAYGIGVERGWMQRSEAVKRTLAALRFFHDAPQGDEADATGDHGFFYHFLDMQTGRRYGARHWVELSTIDTTLLLGGVLFSQSYYDGNSKDEKQIRRLADEIYRRVDWNWASPRPPLVAMGWTPETRFIHVDWQGYNEAMLLYVLALGSPTHAVDSAAWKTWAETQDDYMRKRGIDYFENSRRATLAQREYAIHNPMQWTDYGANIWGLTACNGPRRDIKPGEIDRYARDVKTFYGYIARGAGLRGTIDDGTIAPTAAASSIVFVPEIAIPAIEEIKRRYGNEVYRRYGFVDAFNPSYHFTDRPLRTGHVVPSMGWFDTLYLGIDQGPILAMIENYRSDFVWRVMRRNPYIREGLRRAGFTGGWLDQPAAR